MKTISENLKIIKNSVNNIKNAIFSKGGTIKGDITSYGDAIINIPNEGAVNPTASKNDVTFYDYNGTIRYSYTAEEFLELTEMPPLPILKGLICQGWNCSLEDAKEYVNKYNVLNIGTLYTTYDGKTRLYIRVTVSDMEVPLYVSQTITHGVIIDWGDGSAAETIEGTGKVNAIHKYTSIGDYCISLDIVEGCKLGLGYYDIGLLGDASKASILTKIEIGDSTDKLNDEALIGCTLLSEITLPSHISVSYTKGSFDLSECVSLKFAIINNNMRVSECNFDNCTALSCIVLPVKQSGSTPAFRGCTALESITLPIQFNTIGFQGFHSCTSLKSIVIPNTVKTIDYNAFYNCTSMEFYDFSHHTIIPTLIDDYAFYGIPSGCKIIVPDALYDKWIIATNWSKYSSYIIKKTDWDASKNQ